MEETITKFQEVITELKTHMENYKVSQSTVHKPSWLQAGTRYVQSSGNHLVMEINNDVSLVSMDDI